MQKLRDLLSVRFGALVAAGFLLGALLGRMSHASEPDNFTWRPLTEVDLNDNSALIAVNQKTNQMMAAATADLPDCNLQALHMSLKNALGGGEIGKLEEWVIEDESLKKIVVPMDKSIYAEAGLITHSIGLALMGIVPSVVLNRHYVGADKLGHFFDQGYGYYEEIYVRHGDPLHAIENLGLDDEDGMNGMAGNGIRSYGDMAANFQGYLFWRSVAAGPRPYFRCENKKFVRTQRLFDWSDYISDAWDEAINCSEFSPAVGKAVHKALGNLRCPVFPAACQSILEQVCGYTYLSPACMPFVHVVSMPDSGCIQLLNEDAANQVSRDYQPGFWRGPNASFVADIWDATGTLISSKSRNLQRNLKKLLNLTEKKQQ